MTKPTGRPRGRPKTKEYVTLMARVPQDLADRVQRYAGRKRQTISDMLRDGLLALLQDEDPYRQFTSDMNAASGIMSDIKRDTATQDVQPVILSDLKEALPDNMSDINTESEEASDTKEVQPDILSDTKEAQPDIMSDSIPPFDPAKYVLGKLCPRGHDYHGTGQALLRRTNRHCLACDREKVSERKRAKRP